MIEPLPSPSLSPEELSPEPVKRGRVVLVASAAATLLLYNLPYFGGVLARPLILLATLAHEMGHGLSALLLGGRFQRLLMWLDGAGVAEMDLEGFGRVREAMAVAGGLVGPAVAAAICFTLGRTGRGARACLWGLGLLLLLAEIFWVRNLFGFFFVGAVMALCFLGAWRLSLDRAQVAVVFVGVQLALSIFSHAGYLFTRGVVNPEGSFPSDVAQLERLLFLPYWFWGTVCGGTAVVVLLVGLWSYWRR